MGFNYHHLGSMTLEKLSMEATVLLNVHYWIPGDFNET